jgi:hypothetical protein
MKKRAGDIAAWAVCLGIGCVINAHALDEDYVETAEFTSTVKVAFSGTSATIINGAGDGLSYTQDGAGIVITSAVAGVEYVISGTSAGGYVNIISDLATKVTLNGLTLASTNGPAIAVQCSNRCYVVLAEGSANALSDTSTYTRFGEGTLYSSGPMIFSGRGSLALTGKKKHAVYSGTYIRMLDGDVAVAAAAKDGLHCSEFFRMDNGSLIVAATGDAIDADEGYVMINGGSINIASSTDNVKGITCDGTLTVNGGAVNMTVSGVQSKGLKTGNMTFNGGTLLFNLSGSPYLETVQNITTNGSTITTNTYVDPSSCTAIKCDSNITVNAGVMTITHSGVAGKGISADGNIVIRGGKLDIVTSGTCSATFIGEEGVLDVAAADCLKADGNLEILGGTITATSTGNAGDGISADGYAIIGVAGVSDTPVINVATRGQKVFLYGSGMSAEYSNPKAFKAVGNLTFNGGVFRGSTKNDGGEGMESKANLVINGGTIEITAYDDCINASSNITINGGNIYCYSTGNDGIDSNGTLKITGGTIVSSGTTAPEEGLDCDQNTFTITGGIIVGTGGATSTPTAASCTQRSVKYTGTGTAGVILQVKSASGDNLVYKIPRSYSGGGQGGPGGPGGSGGMVLLFSNPGLASGTTYTIMTGVTISGGTEFHGLYTGATVSGGTTLKTFTPTSMVTTVQ